MIFEFREISKTFYIRKGVFRRGHEFKALDRLSFALNRGIFCGLVGESGSGKTTLARLMCGLYTVSSGQILFEGTPLSDFIRKNPVGFHSKVQMVFQNPYMSLDPRWHVQKIIEEGIRGRSRPERRRRVEEAFDQVGLKMEFLSRKSDALSGGERQRVAIARALVMKPEFLILDEPTSQLDVTIQAQILVLLKKLSSTLVGGLLFITHDLALVSRLVDEILVLRDGSLVERGGKSEVLRNPKSDYTKRLCEAVPSWP